ncbi:hypothetical protein AB0F72_08460 [Actinoplanes sp. NPDC023936]|uniref:hypothetical protein n=1 Tax=Actinoplanes sp. NPDC023936 TaxID=3154910 RepID=UPI0033D473A1
MPTVKIWLADDRRDPFTATVDRDKADECIQQLTNPAAVLYFPDGGTVRYFPVRRINTMTVVED